MENKKKLETLLKQRYPKKVYLEIFNILKQETYSTNDNGIFFNLSQVPEEKILKCISYIECIDNNIEDHLKNLSFRENIETEFKNVVSKQKEKPKEKPKKVKTEKEEEIIIVKKEYKGVYKRIDRVLRGLKPEEKNKRKIEEVEEKVIEEEEVEEKDLFGSDSEEEVETDLQELDNSDNENEEDVI